MLTEVRYPHIEGDRIDRCAALRLQCKEIAAASLASGVVPNGSELGEFTTLVGHAAREGVSVQTALQAVSGACASALRSQASGGDPAVIDQAVQMFRVMEVLGNLVWGIFLGRTAPGVDNRFRVRQLTESILAGDGQSRRLAAIAGVDLAPTYDVMSMMFVAAEIDGPGPHRRCAVDSAAVEAIVTSLAAESGGMLLALGRRGGTVLVPQIAATSGTSVVQRIRATLGVEVVAAAVNAEVDDVPAAATYARELVALAWGLRLPPRVFTTADLALEYQFTRPGPGRSRLKALLRPLDGSPELLHTLQTFISCEGNRRASAKALYVHPNTVDYRLKRIETLTGVDPLSSAGLMSLHAATIVDLVATAEGPGVPGEVAAAC
ncbi:PucR family transcriptional regulator [Rhodococcoides yunnanense]|uniref:PucR family transcriptional regulator n=1 Tax=Rhodococcoides yunnanense TaxID=278209 RepID=UPI00093561BE|nr:helix-turn-helix domain-containing protein [Rhodococcus yunnanensis]